MVVHVARERVRVREALAALRAGVRQARRVRVRVRRVPPQLLEARERAAALRAAPRPLVRRVRPVVRS